MKLGFIGIGNMGNAILKGYLTANPVSEKAIFAYDKDQDRLKSVSEQTGINACDRVPSVVEKSDIVILAIKPDIFGRVLSEVAVAMDWEKKIIVSIAAGITLNYIYEQCRRAQERPAKRISGARQSGNAQYSGAYRKRNERADPK